MNTETVAVDVLRDTLRYFDAQAAAARRCYERAVADPRVAASARAQFHTQRRTWEQAARMLREATEPKWERGNAGEVSDG